ncbi:alpha-L-fucosidase [Seonamhaeicola sp.]|uniref:alpha-L-fucosidase n=1 Tax=Seonamhaeicola sp. TaxID=1912245 RepID=UPI00260A08E8|nr:alpha-L-fucosidase [Seonamhaeicola sp.]
MAISLLSGCVLKKSAYTYEEHNIGEAKGEALIINELGIAEGPFRPTFKSLEKFECPEWFRDAKFGLWAHWGAQSMTVAGDWMAQGMYAWEEDKENNIPESKFLAPNGRYIDLTSEKYGHPSQVGYTKIIDMWKAEKFTQKYANELLMLYKKAGAKYFMALANHHDNFDNWDSKHHRWNSINKGPKKNIVGIWQKASENAGLKFGLTSHLWRSFDIRGRPDGDSKWDDVWTSYAPQWEDAIRRIRRNGETWPGTDSWFGIAHQSDPRPGPFQGMPYDGADPKNFDLFHDYDNPEEYNWPKRWYNRTIDVIGQHRPDLFYLDHQGFMFWEQEIGRKVFAHFFNQGLQKYDGKQEVVLQLKAHFDPKKDMKGMAILDEEASVLNQILPEPWQTDISLGAWWWSGEDSGRNSNWVIDILIDIVSKNGNLLLNIPNHPDGHISQKSVETLINVGNWMEVNGEGIYATRPWKVFGEGPMYDAVVSGKPTMVKQADEMGNVLRYTKRKMGAKDIRFTQSKDGKTIYAFLMSWPGNGEKVSISSLKKHLSLEALKSVELLGVGQLAWKKSNGNIIIELPDQAPFKEAVCLKIECR